ncbi:putative CysN/CysC bifunctional enzyme: Sulfate adenylyltransferase (SAT) subunit 1 (N-terminal); Adenylyl-sulfate kinase (APS kinase)(C-terminal) [Bradyrhizobium sp. ORS 278]|uniref:sulfate adenylyltransferase subunit CysN n=1 Tax=Bradyrhizobium sp. (strain ORS 278) TaxID=114615 RepID=UPI00015089C3|nr:sulfate adenylyltransferase subunit CysN [Bradyrhizobium sp. ORS 278]CAL78884.1 putative CysN/CysC bifunctional enzyme: Sulfate adenylyltransferase (SAT) subunit 1 (N-terminal); Adenylyl-sulfate kinase (APS kinase)(C-terminal) [Bradyrhizobium sp. ORS 278]
MAAAQAPGAPSRDLLRFITCGSVDDGKSTLIGRLLHDSHVIFEDQLRSLASDSQKFGTTGEEIDLALLVDGLEAEREQGITIDVAYRFFSTPLRSFIVADTPGHEQYTRNMATGASLASLAIILIDARKGVLLQTRRHSLICSLLGIRHIVLAINKMDLVDFDKATFDAIVNDYTAFAAHLAFATIVPIPLSARYGHNVTTRSDRTPWFSGPVLIDCLENVDVASDLNKLPFRFPVQRVNRPNLDFRGYSGTVASGDIRVGDRVTTTPAGQTTSVREIVTADGMLEVARAGEAVTLTLVDEIDVSRGDLLASPDHLPEINDQFAAHIIWMSDRPLISGRSYLARIGTRTISMSVTAIRHKMDVNTGERLAASVLALNEIGLCNVATVRPIAFDPYAANRATGSFIVIDRLTNETVGAGMILFGLRRGSNVQSQPLLVNREARAAIKRQVPAVVWFTGLSGAGKSTIANCLEKKLHTAGFHTMLLDGDNIRQGLNRDLGFTEADRVENIRRVGEVAKLFVDAGLIVICSFISPYRSDRDMVRELMPPATFFEVFVDTPLEECMRRDPKGLYSKARAGKIANFTGIDAPYEPPLNPDLHLSTVGHEPEQLAQKIVDKLATRN